jgi:hypothetical protein
LFASSIAILNEFTIVSLWSLNDPVRGRLEKILIVPLNPAPPPAAAGLAAATGLAEATGLAAAAGDGDAGAPAAGLVGSEAGLVAAGVAGAPPQAARNTLAPSRSDVTRRGARGNLII